jgi:hypothetical protein
MSQILDYINEGKSERAMKLLQAKTILDQGGALSAPPQFPGYGYNLTGTTIAKLKPWTLPGEYHSDDLDTALNDEALFNICQFNAIAPSGIGYELGVYNGGVSRMLMYEGRRMVCFDTFEGVKGSGEHDMMEDGEFQTASEVNVRRRLSAAEIVKGDVMDTLRLRPEHEDVAFAHLDMDVYEPTAYALAKIWLRLLPGGVIVCDDYGIWCTFGIKLAVDEFLKSRPNAKSIYLPTGQMVIIK